MVARLRSSIDAAHFSAFFELSIHELLARTSHQIIAVEPEVPDSDYRPDFLVQAPDGPQFYVEVVTSMNETPRAAGAQARLNDAVRVVDETNAKHHFLDLQIEGNPAKPVTLRKLRSALATWITALPTNPEMKGATPFIYEEHGMTLTVTAFFRKTPRKEAGGAIGVQSMQAYWAKPGDGVRESVEKKASRYGTLDLPYVVAINAMSDFQNEQDVIDAMFGSPCVVVRRFEDGRIEHQDNREDNGVWRGPDGPRKQGLTAVLSTERLYPWSVAQRRGRLIRNPWATNPLPAIALGLDELNPERDRLVKTAGSSLAELFGLPEGWPEG